MFGVFKERKGIESDIYFLARIVEHTPLIIIVTHTDGTIQYINLHATKVLGRHRNSLIGSSIGAYCSQIQGELSWHEARKKVLGEKRYSGRMCLTRKNDSDIICMVSVFDISVGRKKPQALVWTFHDISRELGTAEHIERQNMQVARMNTELIRSNAELKRLSELKSNFLSIASHELKTPLTSIKGYSDIIIDNMKDKIDGQVYRMIENINRAADRLHNVVNNILDVTRIEQKRLRLKPEHMDLGTAVRESVEEISGFASSRSITTECHVEEEMPLFYGDRIRMGQVFTNLLTNALKFSPDSSKIVVRVFCEGEHYFHIVIKDCGIGIDKEEQRRVFDPFYEIGSKYRHSTDAAKFLGKGSGLGLSIVKGIIERHGGRIWVESEGVSEGEFPGSEFHFVLPISPEISWDDDETKAMSLSSDETITGDTVAFSLDTGPQPDVGAHPTVLFIDSDPEALEVAGMVLGNAFEILAAKDGAMGLSLAFKHQPALILMDSYLPVIDGYRVCRILRSQEETRHIPIAFFSAGTSNEEIQRCFASGADDYILKPFDDKELLNKIWRLLMKKKEQENLHAD